METSACFEYFMLILQPNKDKDEAEHGGRFQHTVTLQRGTKGGQEANQSDTPVHAVRFQRGQVVQFGPHLDGLSRGESLVDPLGKMFIANSFGASIDAPPLV